MLPAERPGTRYRLFKALLTYRLQQVVERAGFKGADGMLVVGRHNDDEGQRAGWKAFDHVETAEAGHLQIEQHEIRFQSSNLFERSLAVLGFAYGFDIRDGTQAVAQHLAGDRLVIDDQDADWRMAHLPGGILKSAAIGRKTH